jgi:hypothetical protein
VCVCACVCVCVCVCVCMDVAFGLAARPSGLLRGRPHCDSGRTSAGRPVSWFGFKYSKYSTSNSVQYSTKYVISYIVVQYFRNQASPQLDMQIHS